MKTNKKVRGDSSLFTTGLDRRDFIRRIGASSATGAFAVSVLSAKTRFSTLTQGVDKLMLEDLNHTTFAEQVGTEFRTEIEGRTLPFELIEVRPHSSQSNRPQNFGRREPFSLLFRAPKGVTAPQHIYDLEHPALGRVGIFLVPVGADTHGTLYEAVFN